ncbi:hypothetical protein DVK02_19405, partial [Halobellus sp. Atlit-31R]
MPIGTSAEFVDAGLNPYPGGDKWAAMPGVDGEHLFLEPGAPSTDIYFSNAAWSGVDRCAVTGDRMRTLPMANSYLVPHSGKNSSAAFLLADGRTVVQGQPLARCHAGGPATIYATFPDVDLYGSGIPGAHGGSGLSAIGGSI